MQGKVRSLWLHRLMVLLVAGLLWIGLASSTSQAAEMTPPFLEPPPTQISGWTWSGR